MMCSKKKKLPRQEARIGIARRQCRRRCWWRSPHHWLPCLLPQCYLRSSSWKPKTKTLFSYIINGKNCPCSLSLTLWRPTPLPEWIVAQRDRGEWDRGRSLQHVCHKVSVRQRFPDQRTRSLTFVLSTTHPRVRGQSSLARLTHQCRNQAHNRNFRVGAILHRHRLVPAGDPRKQYIDFSQAQNCENKSAAWQDWWLRCGWPTVIPLARVGYFFFPTDPFLTLPERWMGELALVFLTLVPDIISPRLLSLDSYISFTASICPNV